MTGNALRRWTLYATLLLGEKFFFRKGEGFRGGDRGRAALGAEGCRMRVRVRVRVRVGVRHRDRHWVRVRVRRPPARH